MLRPTRKWFIAPAIAYLLVMYVIPVVVMLLTPFNHGVGHGGSQILATLMERGYDTVIWITFRISFEVTAVCLILGYPTAYFLSRLETEKAARYLLLIMFPLWTSILVRTYAWIAILQPQGLINKILERMDIIHQPLHMMYNNFGVVVGMGQILLPYAILAMYGVMAGISHRLMQTAEVLGASPAKAFLRVYLPLSLPGLSAGCLLVFIMALGYFVTPALMGGRHQTMIGVLIQEQVFQLTAWNTAAILSIILLVMTAALLMIYSRFAKLDSLVPTR